MPSKYTMTLNVHYDGNNALCPHRCIVASEGLSFLIALVYIYIYIYIYTVDRCVF